MPHNFTECTQNNDIRCYRSNPSSKVEQAFHQIQQNQMQDMPFINPALSVKAIGFCPFEGDWLGVLLTPWTLSILLLPGPNRTWQAFTVGDKVGLKLPAGDYPFTYGWLPQLGNYFACSVQSPVRQIPSQPEAMRIARDISHLITALPSKTIEDHSRRQLFTRLAKGQAVSAGNE